MNIEVWVILQAQEESRRGMVVSVRIWFLGTPAPWEGDIAPFLMFHAPGL